VISAAPKSVRKIVERNTDARVFDHGRMLATLASKKRTNLSLAPSRRREIA
jgi:hypothetical protein